MGYRFPIQRKPPSQLPGAAKKILCCTQYPRVALDRQRPPPSAWMLATLQYLAPDNNIGLSTSLISCHDSFTSPVQDRCRRRNEGFCACSCIAPKYVESRQRSTSVRTSLYDIGFCCFKTCSLLVVDEVTLTRWLTLWWHCQIQATRPIPSYSSTRQAIQEIYPFRPQDMGDRNPHSPRCRPILYGVLASCRVHHLQTKLDTKRSGSPPATVGLLRRWTSFSQVQRYTSTLWCEENRDTRWYAHAVRDGLLQLRWHNQAFP
jgi:hypothetical protein